MRGLKTGFILIIILFILSLSAEVSAGGKVEKIEVELTVLGTQLRSPVVKQRIIESIKKVGERAILERDMEEVRMVKVSLEKVFQKVFTEVLVGFYVSEVKIKIAPETTIYLTVSASKETVKSIKVALDLTYVHPQWQSLLERELPRIAPKINPILVGIPVKSASWAPEIVGPVIETIIQVNFFFPGFSVDVDLKFGEETVVVLKLRPQKPLVRKVTLKMRSSTIPNFLVDQFKLKLAPYLDMLVGLPVKFVLSQENYLREELDKQVKKAKFKRYGLSLQPSLRIREETKVDLILNSSKYQAKIEAKISLGEEKRPSAEGRGRVGRMFTSRDQVFLYSEFLANSLTLRSRLGLGRSLSPQVFLALLKDIKKKDKFSWLIWERDGWSAEYLQNLDEPSYEVSLSYRLQNFLRVELAKESEANYWIRLVGEF